MTSVQDFFLKWYVQNTKFVKQGITDESYAFLT